MLIHNISKCPYLIMWVWSLYNMHPYLKKNIAVHCRIWNYKKTRYTFETNKRKRNVGLEYIFVATWTLQDKSDSGWKGKTCFYFWLFLLKRFIKFTYIRFWWIKITVQSMSMYFAIKFIKFEYKLGWRKFVLEHNIVLLYFWFIHSFGFIYTDL